MNPNPWARQSASAAVKTIFVLVKILVILLGLAVGALAIGQTSVAPVSSRLLLSYAVEYATATFKPYRHLFPQPYIIDLEQK